MNFKALLRHFKFTSQQRTGILLLFIIIIVLQAVYFLANFSIPEKSFPEKQEWISLQTDIDSLKSIKYNEKPKVYTFNPNFISDYRGYKLGMSIEEIDRLLAFRKENKYVNSVEEFQQVTKVSDSLLKVISPLFKFPDWTQNKSTFKTEKKEYVQKSYSKKEKTEVLDINVATQEDLIKVYGIGEALSLRILKQKEILGCFVSMDQMKDIWGLSAEVVVELNSHFKVVIPSNLKKIAVNDASLKELSQFPYFRYALAKQIVTTRSMNGNFNNIEDLSKIKDFPVDKAKIISLYLEF
ncbi:DNA uptake protein ComE-like DNA-binding protein [Flavobacterium sp. 90]|uniref:ComEA family DNA-binding protein n=1 Tax=unclassified Flavobacterium TaxID=196869 RepID=UPI000EB47710|nr:MULTISPECIES: helix-hairpin-helix domain-containing protein [unclassified Flavobacterium]RKR09145.1 DNA uptake protein ComE-like DNA-binding protein [Flavobacterium sp. 81]TCK52928.1 DNA uptake protein ComE-like DNA-binding protein [Flavobacterium sp. 90]